MSENSTQVQTKPKKVRIKIKKNVKTIKEKKHEKGQYFTTNTFLKENVYKLIENNPSIILEPSIGQGDLIDYIKKKKNQKLHFIRKK